MYIIAIAWLYVVLIAAISDTTVVGGVLTFVFWGVGPLAFFLWLAGPPARRHAAARREDMNDAPSNDRTDSNIDQ